MTKNKIYFSILFFVSSFFLFGGFFSSKIERANSYVSNRIGLGQHWFADEEEDGYNSPEQKLIDVLHYTIKLDLFPEQKRLKGDVTLQFVFTDSLDKKFHINFYDNLKIHKVLWNGLATNYSNYKTSLTVEHK